MTIQNLLWKLRIQIVANRDCTYFYCVPYKKKNTKCVFDHFQKPIQMFVLNAIKIALFYSGMKIAAKAFNRSVSESTCRLMWKNHLHPSINRGKWSKQEDRRLMELIDQPDEDGLMRPRKDWDKIANKVRKKSRQTARYTLLST